MSDRLSCVAHHPHRGAPPVFWTVIIIVAFMSSVIGAAIGWRWASRRWPLPCPSLFGWALESRCYGWWIGTQKTLKRMRLQPGMRILEIGPGPGRLLIPAAQRVLPRGKAVGLDIQPGMIERLRERAEAAGLSNLRCIVGDASKRQVDPDTFDLVFLVTTLGEIPDREAALAESYQALKQGGHLSVTEIFGDPHYQPQSTVIRLAEEAGFRLHAVEGTWCFYTVTFEKGLRRSH